MYKGVSVDEAVERIRQRNDSNLAAMEDVFVCVQSG